jgi:hypothetical protein
MYTMIAVTGKAQSTSAKFATASEAVDALRVIVKAAKLVTVNTGGDEDILDWKLVEPVSMATVGYARVGVR